MIITAKFASVCPCCNARIEVGSKVEWTKGSRASHVSCGRVTSSGAVVSASRPAYRARRPRTARYCEGWGADNPHAPRPNYTCTECADC